MWLHPVGFRSKADQSWKSRNSKIKRCNCRTSFSYNGDAPVKTNRSRLAVVTSFRPTLAVTPPYVLITYKVDRTLEVLHHASKGFISPVDRKELKNGLICDQQSRFSWDSHTVTAFSSSLSGSLLFT